MGIIWSLHTLNVLKIGHVIYKVYSKKLESWRDERVNSI